MSIYFRDYPEWDSHWESYKQPLVSANSITDLSVLTAMDDMAVFGSRDAADSNGSSPSAELAGTKSVHGVTGTTYDQVLQDSYSACYDNYGDFVAANPDPSKLPPRPPR